MKQLCGIHQRYSGKSYSDAFECQTCGHSERRNLNFLGGRLLICDGVKRERSNAGNGSSGRRWRQRMPRGENLHPMFRSSDKRYTARPPANCRSARDAWDSLSDPARGAITRLS